MEGGLEHQTEPAWRDPSPILKARSVAIIGATPGARWVEIFLEQIPKAGFRGPVWPIHPSGAMIGEHRCYKSLRDAPSVPEHALLHVSTERTLAVLEEAAEAGVKSATIYATGWAEMDEAGRSRQDALVRLTERTGLRLCGPNCLGFMSVREGLIAYPMRVLDWLKPGAVGAVFQSGALLYPFVRAMGERGAGFSYLVSCGNEVGADSADYMKFLVEDTETRAIALLLEGVRAPAKFRAALELALEADKPIAVMKVGRSERALESARTHTGALAGSARVFDALCRRHGIAQCDSLEQLVETSRLLAAGRRPSGSRAGMLIFSGSLRSHILDTAADAGVELAQPGAATVEKLRAFPELDLRIVNPMDCGVVQATQSKYMEVARALLEDPGVDLLLVQEHPPDPRRGRSGAALKAVAEASGKPVLVSSEAAYSMTPYAERFIAEAGVPFLQGFDHGMKALGQLSAYAQLQRRRKLERKAERANPAGVRWRPGLHGLAAIGDELKRCGVPVIAHRLARSADEAAEAAAGLGFPVALKIESSDLAHKSDAGGVRLALSSAEAVRRAWDDMRAEVARRAPGARLEGALVARMAAPGVEMSLGIQNDPQFGLALMVALGGIWIEVLDDASLRLLPVDEAEAREMIAELKSAKLLQAFRGAPPRDVGALAHAMVGLSRFALEHAEGLDSIDINPIIVHAQGASAVDARMIIR